MDPLAPTAFSSEEMRERRNKSSDSSQITHLNSFASQNENSLSSERPVALVNQPLGEIFKFIMNLVPMGFNFLMDKRIVSLKNPSSQIDQELKVNLEKQASAIQTGVVFVNQAEAVQDLHELRLGKMESRYYSTDFQLRDLQGNVMADSRSIPVPHVFKIDMMRNMELRINGHLVVDSKAFHYYLDGPTELQENGEKRAFIDAPDLYFSSLKKDVAALLNRVEEVKQTIAKQKYEAVPLLKEKAAAFIETLSVQATLLREQSTRSAREEGLNEVVAHTIESLKAAKAILNEQLVKERKAFPDALLDLDLAKFEENIRRRSKIKGLDYCYSLLKEGVDLLFKEVEKLKEEVVRQKQVYPLSSLLQEKMDSSIASQDQALQRVKQQLSQAYTQEKLVEINKKLTQLIESLNTTKNVLVENLIYTALYSLREDPTLLLGNIERNQIPYRICCLLNQDAFCGLSKLFILPFCLSSGYQLEKMDDFQNISVETKDILGKGACLQISLANCYKAVAIRENYLELEHPYIALRREILIPQEEFDDLHGSLALKDGCSGFAPSCQEAIEKLSAQMEEVPFEFQSMA